MNAITTKSSLAASVAVAAAALFALGAAPLAAHAEDAGVKCSGVNSCKGTSECKTAKSECKGHNSCKGQGWVNKKTADECMKAGGTVVKG
jgi:hypothetical protein